MPLYTYYPRRADGISTAFETMDLADDSQASRFAQSLFADFPRAAQVEVWEGARLVLICPKSGAPVRPLRRP